MADSTTELSSHVRGTSNQTDIFEIRLYNKNLSAKRPVKTKINKLQATARKVEAILTCQDLKMSKQKLVHFTVSADTHDKWPNTVSSRREYDHSKAADKSHLSLHF